MVGIYHTFSGEMFLVFSNFTLDAYTQVIWYRDGRPVKESKDIQLLFRGDQCSLVIKETFVEDAGEYRVVAINSAGEASSQCVLNVQSKPGTHNI